MKYLRSCRVLVLALAAWFTACTGWRLSAPPRPSNPAVARRIAEGVVLQVHDEAVDWGGGRLGDIVRDTLVASGAFAEVYYPVEPPNPPSTRLRIEAFASEQERGGKATLIVQGVLPLVILLFPIAAVALAVATLGGARVMKKTFTVEANVLLSNSGRELRRFSTSASATVSYNMLFSKKDAFEAAAAEVAFRQLGEQIAAAL